MRFQTFTSYHKVLFFSLVRSSAGFLRVMVSPKFSSKLVFSREINVCEVLQVLGNVFSPHNAAPKKNKTVELPIQIGWKAAHGVDTCISF